VLSVGHLNYVTAVFVVISDFDPSNLKVNHGVPGEVTMAAIGSYGICSRASALSSRQESVDQGVLLLSRHGDLVALR